MKPSAARAAAPAANGDLVSWMAGTQLLARSVSLLLYLRECETPVTVGDLARALKVPINTVYRIVRTLELGGLVDRSSRPYVSLGLRLMDLGQAKQREVARELEPVAMPVLESTTSATGETSLLVMPTGARAICILAVEPKSAIRLSFQPGRVFPLFAGASGKVLLPWLSTPLLDSAIAQGDGHRLPSGRRLTAASLKRDVRAIRADGFCVTHGELDPGASAVGAPVFGRGKQIFAAFSVAGPSSGFLPERLPGLIDHVVSAAATIGRGLSAMRASAAVGDRT